MNPSYEFDTVRQYDIQMTLPSLDYYYRHKEQLQDIKVHIEFENLLHRSGFRTLDEIHEVLSAIEQEDEDHRVIVEGLWTHFGYADEFDVPEYQIERSLVKDCRYTAFRGLSF